MRHIRFITIIAIVCACPAPSFAQAGPSATLEQRSVQFAGSYLQVWSSSSRAAIAAVPRLYAPRVLFYGRVLARRRPMREKARFVQRWPVRHYADRPGTMRVSCDALASNCMVRSVVNWRVESPARSAKSQGLSRFEQGIDPFAARSCEGGELRPTVGGKGVQVVASSGAVRSWDFEILAASSNR